MEMGAGRAAGGADAADELPAGPSGRPHPDRREVAVAAGDPVPVVDLDHVAVAARILGRDQRPERRWPGRRALFGLEIEPLCRAGPG